MSKILVTGGAGYVGSHTCKALAMAGLEPVVYDNLSSGHAWAVKWGPLERGDIADRRRLDSVISAYRPVAIMHFAAFAYVGESVVEPAKYYRNNVAGTLNLLEAARDNAISDFVFSSSCATYGIPAIIPIVEDTPQKPINPYGNSKQMVETILSDFGRAYGLRSIILRYFNAAGADPDNQIGEDHDPETHLIPLTLDAASGRRENMTILGTDYDTPDGTCIRDYIHVSDLADAHVRALQRLLDGQQPDSFNLGNDNGFSVRQVIECVERVAGARVYANSAPRRPGDPPVLVSDSTRARTILGWQPQITALDDIVRTAWAWHQRNSNKTGKSRGQIA
jgi:UDP-arabinose 4-epimerase